MKDASLDYATTEATWKSYGKFNGEHRISCLDHVYFAGLDCNVEVLKDTTTDHRPVLAKILVPSGKTGTRSIERRNFKAIQLQELEDALQKWPWTTIYSIEDVDTVHQFLIDGITEALNEIAKVVKAMRATEALGVDGIPVSVLKKGIEVLAGPISHLVNRSLASGTVPTALKLSNVLPIYKGKGKSAADPASYRPVCILPALSKILETVVKTDFEIHLAKTEALPNTQFGFRRGRSTTTALATAHAKWLKAKQRGKVVGVLGFDLSAAFDTVDQLQLLPKLKKLGIEGMQLEWFKSYLSGGSQRVVWNGAESDFLNVKYGVRQGSILGPILYLVLVADVTSCVGIGDEENSSYADDFFLWAVGDSLEEVGLLLETKADAFSKYAWVLNAAKTQFMIGGKAKKKDTSAFTIRVGGVELHPSDEIEFLGVKFDSDFTTAPHNAYVVKAAKQRAALIS
ncbi:Uncharacterized protein FKW44_014045, partial [Caligus rogercresseyi]